MATCKDCIHNSVCELWRREEWQDAKFYAETEGGECEYFADESRFMELPCKCGDTVWYLNRINEVCEAVVTVIEINLFTNPQTWISLKYQSVMFGEHTYKSRIDMALGKTVFFTREEAEAELEKRMHKPTTVSDNSERCVCCGDVIPEGRQVCPKCEKGT